MRSVFEDQNDDNLFGMHCPHLYTLQWLHRGLQGELRGDSLPLRILQPIVFLIPTLERMFLKEFCYI